MKLEHKNARLRATLTELCAVLGPDRGVTLCRELTKVHEQIVKTTLGEAAALYESADPRGEYVLVLAGAAPAALDDGAPALEQAVAAARALLAQGLPPAAAARQAAAGTPYGKNEIYRALVERE